MKKHLFCLVLLVAELLALSSHAVTLYVDINSGTPVSPYTNWSTAATSIQVALDEASSNDTVLVAAGFYTENITLKSGVSLQGSGADVTTIEGMGGTVVTATNLNEGTVITGFTITGGSYNGRGGGIYCENASLLIADCIITANHAYWNGGGIYCKNSSPVIANNLIEGNHVREGRSGVGGKGGGGIYCYLNSSPVITNNVIRGNLVLGGGGGIGCDYDSSPLIANNIIEKNAAVDGDGGVEAGGTSVISNNLITSNVGGGLGVWGSALVANNLIADNQSPFDGGGITCWEDNATVVNNVIAFNEGGRYGGGIYCYYVLSSTRIVNNLIYNNRSFVSGGGIFSDGVSPLIANCIIWGNEDDLSGCSAIYSCIEDGDPGDGNISSDPMFVYAPSRNYRLLSGSPCIDAGTNAYVSTSVDMGGNPRIVSGTMDMGPYEFQAGGSAVNLHIQAILQKSSDLQIWTNSDKHAEWSIPADSSNEFYRVWLNL